MARRNDHSRDELIELTLSSVEKYLETSSYHSLSLRKTAAMIGYVPSTLINIFGSYNLLLLHVVSRSLDQLQQQAAQALAQVSNPQAGILALGHVYLHFALAHPYLWQLMFEHNMQGDKLPEWHSARIQSMTGMLETLLTQLAPERSDTDVIQASRVLWAGVHGITLLSVDDKFFTAAPVNGEQLIENLLAAYLPQWVASERETCQ